MHWMRNLCQHLSCRRIWNERRKVSAQQSKWMLGLPCMWSAMSWRCNSGNRVNQTFSPRERVFPFIHQNFKKKLSVLKLASIKFNTVSITVWLAMALAMASSQNRSQELADNAYQTWGKKREVVRIWSLGSRCLSRSVLTIQNGWVSYGGLRVASERANRQRSG